MNKQIGGEHYLLLSIEPFDVMESWFTREQYEGYLRGCALKYLARYPNKGGVEDIKKAIHYLETLVEHIEK